MSRAPQSFDISDDDGKPVQYSFTPFAGGPGLVLMRRLTKTLGGPLGQIAGSIQEDGVDGDGLSAAVRDLADALAASGDVTLFRDILDGCTRVQDGKTIIPGSGGEQQDFDQAYQANYGELFHAVTLSLKVNYGGMFRHLSKKLGNGILAKIKATMNASTKG